MKPVLLGRTIDHGDALPLIVTRKAAREHGMPEGWICDTWDALNDLVGTRWGNHDGPGKYLHYQAGDVLLLPGNWPVISGYAKGT